MSKEVLEVQCPHCKEQNNINLSKEIKCKSCDKSLTTKKYTKKALISSTTALIIGIGAGVYLDERFETDRYPLKVEYKIINSCISQDSRALSRKDYLEKTNICICAQEKTIKDISYSDYKNDSLVFLNKFETNVLKCM